MLADFAGIRTPAFLLLNMMDVAKDQGKTIDPQRLEKKLGIPVVAFSATDVRHYDGFYRALDRVLRDRPLLDTWDLEQEYQKKEGFTGIKELMPQTASSSAGRASPWPS